MMTSGRETAMEAVRETAWQPLLDGELADRADEAVTAIADALAGIGDVPPASLDRGGPGIALFFAYLDRVRPAQGHDERAHRLLDDAFDRLAAGPIGSSLFAGFSGVAWTAEHILGDGHAAHPQDDLDGASESDPNASVDEALIALLERSPWPEDHDLITGLAGLAVHAFERLPRRSARRCLELVLDRLAELAERKGGRATWKTRPQHLIEPTRSEYPAGYYNLGVAHGVPAQVAVLARIAAAGIGGGRSRELYREATAWVLDQRLDSPAGRSLFAPFVGPDISPVPARFAWCYGDPGVAATLLAAARAAGDAELHRTALGLARRAAAEPTSRRDVIDASLCHGAGGVGHLFNRMHQSSGDEACADAARRWFARALDMRTPEGLAGYRYRARPRDPDSELRDDPGLITGIAGIGLALLGAITTVEPAWDRLLLASLAPL
jgi:lantibiotic modifying enzyme